MYPLRRFLRQVVSATALALAPAAAGALPFTATFTLDLRIPAEGGSSQPAFDQAVVLSGAGDATADGAGGFALAAGALSGSFSIPGPPRAAPVTQLSGSFTTQAGSFTAGSGGVLGGTLGLSGSWQFQLFSTVVAQLPVTPIGVGGSETVATEVSPTTTLAFQLDGGPWTSGDASVSIPGVLAPIAGSGFDARDAGGLGPVRLVTPVRIVPLSLGPSAAQYAAVASLDLLFVPEPGTALLLGVSLVGAGAARRSRARATAAVPI